MIKKIKISNFKSFKNVDLQLGSYNLLIGCNACGKSNFLQIFKFIHDFIKYGLVNAVTIQGGVEYFRNIKIGAQENFNLEIEWKPETNFGRTLDEASMNSHLIIENVSYNISFAFNKSKITSESILEQIKLRASLGSKDDKSEGIKKLDSGEINISKSRDEFKFESWSDKIKEEYIFPPFLKSLIASEKKERRGYSSLINWVMLFIPPLSGISEIGMYDFDPKLPKRSVKFSGQRELEEDGNNMSFVLKDIINDSKKYASFMNLVQGCLPFIRDFEVEELIDKSSLFKLREIYFPKKYLPASLVSDGTINIIALIIALYFEKPALAIIEEPERNIHPFLISRVMTMLKDASSKKQIIISSHNPLIVKYVALENLYLVAKDEISGISEIIKPSELDEVKTFVKNKIGLDEMFVQGLFGEK